MNDFSSNVKAIQTHYNGYYFRSRIEARWAVFFDELGIKYEYEKEGYRLPSGCYLPDFWLPTEKMWVEIKGQMPTANEMQKAWELSEATSYPVIILYGYMNTEAIAFADLLIDSNGGRECRGLRGNIAFDCQLCVRFDLPEKYESILQFDHAINDYVPVKNFMITHTDKTASVHFYRASDLMPDVLTEAALETAKSARFESWDDGGIW